MSAGAPELVLIGLNEPCSMQREDCAAESIPDRHDRLVPAALRRIDGSNVVPGEQGSFRVPDSCAAFMLDKAVICSGNYLRTRLILTASRGGDIKRVGRYNVASPELNDPERRISADIEAAVAQ